MKPNLLLIFITLCFFSCEGEAEKKNAERKQAKLLTNKARNFLQEGEYDSASSTLTKAIILDMDSSKESVSLLRDIRNYTSPEYLEQTFRKIEPDDYKRILADKPLDYHFMEDRSLDSLFLIKLKSNKEVGLKLIRQGAKDRRMAPRKVKEQPAPEIKPSTALEAVKLEPKVLDAYITDAHVLYVQVRDDGTRRDGYAEYLCQLLKTYHSTANRVKVVKVGSQNDPNRDNAYGVLLGESWCQ